MVLLILCCHSLLISVKSTTQHYTIYRRARDHCLLKDQKLIAHESTGKDSHTGTSYEILPRHVWEDDTQQSQQAVNNSNCSVQSVCIRALTPRPAVLCQCEMSWVCIQSQAVVSLSVHQTESLCVEPAPSLKTASRLQWPRDGGENSEGLEQEESEGPAPDKSQWVTTAGAPPHLIPL